MFRGGHDEFVDSATNGPWGTALTTELMPAIEAKYRAIGTPATRFVAGHSSGGWSALWLEVTYPDRFGGEWSLAPDPVDFRDFMGSDLTASGPRNIYADAAGIDRRVNGATLRSLVFDPKWGARQFDSFDAVFGPAGEGGRPRPLFERGSGNIDPQVAAYWEAHFDIARILRDHWTALGPQLRGKIHIVVGTNDNFGLDRPVALLKKELDGLQAGAQIEFVAGADHWTVFGWHGNALSEIVREAHAAMAAPSSPQ